MAVWMHRDDHLAQHQVGQNPITVEQAEEALNDPNRLVFDPDPARTPGGRGVRTVGYSGNAGAVLCVISVTQHGITYGATAFKANATLSAPIRRGGG